MKYILFLSAIIVSLAVSAQNNNSPWVKKKDAGNGQLTLAALPQATLLHTLPNGNKIYALPQDRMPCLVPDLPNKSGITLQPFRYNGPGAIPNPAQPIMKERSRANGSSPGQQVEIISPKNQKPRL